MKSLDSRWSSALARAGAPTLRFWVALSHHGMWIFVLAALTLKVLVDASLTILLFTVFATHGLTLMLQAIFHRERPANPSFPLLMPTFSFPSAHASTAASSAMALWPYALRLDESVGLALGVALFVLAVGIALSRVVARMHYVTDVVVGFALGVVMALVLPWGMV